MFLSKFLASNIFVPNGQLGESIFYPMNYRTSEKIKLEFQNASKNTTKVIAKWNVKNTHLDQKVQSDTGGLNPVSLQLGVMWPSDIFKYAEEERGGK